MLRRIIVPLDGSRVGESALPYVEELVSKLSPELNVEITLLQVLSPVTPIAVGGMETADILYTPTQIDVIENKHIFTPCDITRSDMGVC